MLKACIINGNYNKEKSLTRNLIPKKERQHTTHMLYLESFFNGKLLKNNFLGKQHDNLLMSLLTVSFAIELTVCGWIRDYIQCKFFTHAVRLCLKKMLSCRKSLKRLTEDLSYLYSFFCVLLLSFWFIRIQLTFLHKTYFTKSKQ